VGGGTWKKGCCGPSGPRSRTPRSLIRNRGPGSEKDSLLIAVPEGCVDALNVFFFVGIQSPEGVPFLKIDKAGFKGCGAWVLVDADAWMPVRESKKFVDNSSPKSRNLFEKEWSVFVGCPGWRRRSDRALLLGIEFGSSRPFEIVSYSHGYVWCRWPMLSTWMELGLEELG
jgi:hypothetical protein